MTCNYSPGPICPVLSSLDWLRKVKDIKVLLDPSSLVLFGMILCNSVWCLCRLIGYLIFFLTMGYFHIFYGSLVIPYFSMPAKPMASLGTTFEFFLPTSTFYFSSEFSYFFPVFYSFCTLLGKHQHFLALAFLSIRIA